MDDPDKTYYDKNNIDNIDYTFNNSDNYLCNDINREVDLTLQFRRKLL